MHCDAQQHLEVKTPLVNHHDRSPGKHGFLRGRTNPRDQTSLQAGRLN